ELNGFRSLTTVSLSSPTPRLLLSSSPLSISIFDVLPVDGEAQVLVAGVRQDVRGRAAGQGGFLVGDGEEGVAEGEDGRAVAGDIVHLRAAVQRLVQAVRRLFGPV